MARLRVLTALGVLLLASWTAADPIERRAIYGLAELPEVLGYLDPYHPGTLLPLVNPRPVRFFEEPKSSAKWSELSSAELEVEEIFNEVKGAVVYSRRKDWFEVGTREGRRWITRKDALRVHELPDLLKQRPPKFTPAWDKRVADKPGGELRRAALGSEAELSPRLESARRVKGRLWLKIQVLEGTTCGGKRPGRIDGGWVPAHTETGEPTVWFHSRGC